MISPLSEDDMPGKPSRERFNEMLVDIDVSMFDLQARLARFIGELLDEMRAVRAEIHLPIAHQQDDECSILHCSEIYYDAESEVFMLIVTGRDLPLPWDEISIAAQYLIVQQLFVRHVADTLYDSRS